MVAGKMLCDSFARQELHLDTPVVRVGLHIEGVWLEDVVMLNGEGFDSAVLRATNRALGLPDGEWELVEKLDLTEGQRCNGLLLRVKDPEGKVREADFQFEAGLRSKGVAMAMAFARIARDYSVKRGTNLPPEFTGEGVV